MKRRKSIGARLLAVAVVCVLLAALAALPSLAMGMGSSPNGMNGQKDGRGIGDRIVDGVRNGAETVADGVESIVDDLTDIPNGQEPAGDGMLGDADPDMADGTNIPDEHIGGAVADNDGDHQPDAQDLDDDNDGTPDKADADADGDGLDDTDESTGMVGIVIAVLVVVAIIILVIAVLPRARKR